MLQRKETLTLTRRVTGGARSRRQHEALERSAIPALLPSRWLPAARMYNIVNYAGWKYPYCLKKSNQSTGNCRKRYLVTMHYRTIATQYRLCDTLYFIHK